MQSWVLVGGYWSRNLEFAGTHQKQYSCAKPYHSYHCWSSWILNHIGQSWSGVIFRQTVPSSGVWDKGITQDRCDLIITWLKHWVNENQDHFSSVEQVFENKKASQIHKDLSNSVFKAECDEYIWIFKYLFGHSFV